MAGTPTPNFGLPQYDRSDTAALDTLLNGVTSQLDTSLKVAIDNIGYGAGLEADKPVTASDGYTWYSTDTKVQWRYLSGTWTLAGFGPFKTTQVYGAATGTVSSIGAMGPLTGVTVNLALTSPVACRAKVTLECQSSIIGVGTALSLGVAASGATTIAPSNTDNSVLRAVGSTSVRVDGTISRSDIVNLNAGTTTLSVVGQAEGSGGTREVKLISLLVEPVSE